MTLEGDSVERLGAFLAWAKHAGMSDDRVSTWRPLADKLLRVAGDGRVLEGHILSLIDAAHAQPAEVTLIEEVGEALLRWQALAKPIASERPTREIPKMAPPAIQKPST